MRVNIFAISCLLYVIGIIYFVVFTQNAYNKPYYMSENALMPDYAETHFDVYKNILELQKAADVLIELENSGSEKEQLLWIKQSLESLGLDVFEHKFNVTKSFTTGVHFSDRSGLCITGLLRAKRHDGTESIVISAPIHLIYRDKYSVNGYGVSLALSLASYYNSVNYLAKDIIFLFTTHGGSGIESWLEAYHGLLNGGAFGTVPKSGVIQAALNLEFETSSGRYSYASLLPEGNNGQLPNLDLINTMVNIGRRHGLPLKLHEVPPSSPEVSNTLVRLVAMLRMMSNQALGHSSASHGAFLRYKIDAVTLYVRDLGDGLHSIGHLGPFVESTLRSLNNLLEHLHQSFFYYLIPELGRYISIGLYLPAFYVMISGLLITTLVVRSSVKSDADWSKAVVAIGLATVSVVVIHQFMVFTIKNEILHVHQALILSACAAQLACWIIPISQFSNQLPETKPVGWKIVQESRTDRVRGAALIMSAQLTSDDPNQHENVWHVLKVSLSAGMLSVLALLSALNFGAAFLIGILVMPVYLTSHMFMKKWQRLCLLLFQILLSPPLIIALIVTPYTLLSTDTATRVRLTYLVTDPFGELHQSNWLPVAILFGLWPLHAAHATLIQNLRHH